MAKLNHCIQYNTDTDDSADDDHADHFQKFSQPAHDNVHEFVGAVGVALNYA